MRKKTIWAGFLFTLAAGVAAALTFLLSRPRAVRVRRGQTDAESGTITSDRAAKQRNFSIRRTKSELGYVYWVLQGFGKYSCYTLYDSWEEAIEGAKARIEEIDGRPQNAASTLRF
jgi:hypothetical protein